VAVETLVFRGKRCFLEVWGDPVKRNPLTPAFLIIGEFSEQNAPPIDDAQRMHRFGAKILRGEFEKDRQAGTQGQGPCNRKHNA